MNNTSIDCTLVTCIEYPELDDDDRILVYELHRRGIRVDVAAWNDPNIDWSQTRLVLLRSCWDYYKHYRDFLGWTSHVASVSAIRNVPGLLWWNADKWYLRDLESRGVPIVPTHWVRQGEKLDLTALAKSRAWPELVVKPSRGAAADNVLLVHPTEESRAAGQAHVDGLLQAQDALIQPFVSTVADYGERALVFFGGRFSHAVRKKPFDRVMIVSNERSAVVDPCDDELAVASQAIAALRDEPLYARVDLLRSPDGQVYVNELELIEPGLYLAVHGPARTTFADLIEAELRTAPVREPGRVLS